MTKGNIIKFEKVGFSYDNHQIIQNLSFFVNKGEFICLTGKSGCGKSTLLRLINGLLKKDNGKIEIINKPIENWNPHELRKHMGYVLQDGALFPHFNVYQNMCYCMKLQYIDKNKCNERINELLPLVNLDKSILAKFPNQLSGGQQQRVGIIRAIAHNPDIVLMDEPFSALDSETRENLHELVKNIHLKLNTTFVMVTHLISEAEKLGTRTIRLSNGKIIAND